MLSDSDLQFVGIEVLPGLGRIAGDLIDLQPQRRRRWRRPATAEAGWPAAMAGCVTWLNGGRAAATRPAAASTRPARHTASPAGSTGLAAARRPTSGIAANGTPLAGFAAGSRPIPTGQSAQQGLQATSQSSFFTHVVVPPCKVPHRPGRRVRGA